MPRAYAPLAAMLVPLSAAGDGHDLRGGEAGHHQWILCDGGDGTAERAPVQTVPAYPL